MTLERHGGLEHLLCIFLGLDRHAEQSIHYGFFLLAMKAKLSSMRMKVLLFPVLWEFLHADDAIIYSLNELQLWRFRIEAHCIVVKYFPP